MPPRVAHPEGKHHKMVNQVAENKARADADQRAANRWTPDQRSRNEQRQRPEHVMNLKQERWITGIEFRGRVAGKNPAQDRDHFCDHGGDDTPHQQRASRGLGQTALWSGNWR